MLRSIVTDAQTATPAPRTGATTPCTEERCNSYGVGHPTTDGPRALHVASTIAGPRHPDTGEASFTLTADKLDGEEWSPSLDIPDPTLTVQAAYDLLQALRATHELCLALNAGEASA